MSGGPLVLGINRTQDASVCLTQGSRLPWPERPIDVVVECFSSDKEIRRLAQYDDELAATLAATGRLAPDCRRARISHHLAHVYSVFHPSPFREAAVMIVDGQGSPVSELTGHWSGAACVPGDWREVGSFYRADRESVLCIGKQLWDRDDARLVAVAGLQTAGRSAPRFRLAGTAAARWRRGRRVEQISRNVLDRLNCA